MRVDDAKPDGPRTHPRASSETNQPVYNERGIIAESYYDLQGLGVLDAARKAYPLPKASGESTLRAIFQGVEIALLNLANVMRRAANDVEQGLTGVAVVKLFWARGFHRLLVRLGMMPHQLGLMSGCSSEQGVLRIQQSPAFAEYLAALQLFDRSVLSRIRSGELSIEETVAERTLDSVDFNLIHLARIGNHESTVWERSLAEVHVPAPVPSYEAFVVAHQMREAVYERELSGDTYFTQFRGLHQIPETLGEEVNDRMEEAIRGIRDRRLAEALEHLGCVDVLSEGILAALPPIADNLSTSDYHRIRENLGLTSGSHSVCLRFHLFTHLYEQLWEEVRALAIGGAEGRAEDVVAAIRGVDAQRFSDTHAGMVHELSNYCLKLRTFVLHWREEHLNLPRNNLGGDYTKSLTGSPDAVQAVRQMRESARGKDAMLPLARARQVVGAPSEMPVGQLTRYLDSSTSLDNHVLSVTGRVTQQRFRDVQERLGFFANRCPFTPPPRRRA